MIKLEFQISREKAHCLINRMSIIPYSFRRYSIQNEMIFVVWGWGKSFKWWFKTRNYEILAQLLTWEFIISMANTTNKEKKMEKNAYILFRLKSWNTESWEINQKMETLPTFQISKKQKSKHLSILEYIKKKIHYSLPWERRIKTKKHTEQNCYSFKLLVSSICILI